MNCGLESVVSTLCKLRLVSTGLQGVVLLSLWNAFSGTCQQQQSTYEEWRTETVKALFCVLDLENACHRGRRYSRTTISWEIFDPDLLAAR